MRKDREPYRSADTATREIFPPTLHPAIYKSRGLARVHGKAHPNRLCATDIFWAAAHDALGRIVGHCGRCAATDGGGHGSDLEQYRARRDGRRAARP